MRCHSFLFLTIALLLMGMGYDVQANTKPVRVASPDGQLVFTLQPGSRLSYSISLKGVEVVQQSSISLALDNGKVLGHDADVDKRTDRQVNTVAKGNFYKKATVPYVFNEAEVTFEGGYGLVVRVFNDGAAYRWVTTQKGRVKILAEQSQIKLPTDTKLFAAYAKYRDLFCSFESTYDTLPISKLDTAKVINLPLLATTANKTRILITESDLQDYPGWNLKSNQKGGNVLDGEFARVVTTIKGMADGKADYDLSRPTGRANYIAETDGDRHFPWRVFTITSSDADLVNSDLVYLLARPSLIEDLAWVKPGKAVWEWWNNWNLWGIDFKAGKNTQTYKWYIDYAAANKLEYVVMDEGWATSMETMLKVVPEINLEELVNYGKTKNVGIILWGTGYALDKEMTEVYSIYSKMGVKGFKIDFMDRDDQYMVNFMERALREGAKYKLLLDFHGTFKPTGLNRTWPNEINREGIYGNEQNKWSKELTTYQQVLYPFIRLVAGHADFTPGAMRNANKNEFRPIFNQPMSQGTRCHQLAMYVLYDGPLQMLCESPQYYAQDKPVETFLADVPTTWDEVRVISAELGNHLVLAKRKGDKWYIGGMAHTPTKVTVNLGFLPKGQFDVQHFRDGINVDRNGNDYAVSTTTTNNKSSISLDMAVGGGALLILSAQ